MDQNSKEKKLFFFGQPGCLNVKFDIPIKPSESQSDAEEGNNAGSSSGVNKIELQSDEESQELLKKIDEVLEGKETSKSQEKYLSVDEKSQSIQGEDSINEEPCKSDGVLIKENIESGSALVVASESYEKIKDKNDDMSNLESVNKIENTIRHELEGGEPRSDDLSNKNLENNSLKTVELNTNETGQLQTQESVIVSEKYSSNASPCRENIEQCVENSAISPEEPDNKFGDVEINPIQKVSDIIVQNINSKNESSASYDDETETLTKNQENTQAQTIQLTKSEKFIQKSCSSKDDNQNEPSKYEESLKCLEIENSEKLPRSQDDDSEGIEKSRTFKAAIESETVENSEETEKLQNQSLHENLIELTSLKENNSISNVTEESIDDLNQKSVPENIAQVDSSLSTTEKSTIDENQSRIVAADVETPKQCVENQESSIKEENFDPNEKQEIDFSDKSNPKESVVEESPENNSKGADDITVLKESTSFVISQEISTNFSIPSESGDDIIIQGSMTTEYENIDSSKNSFIDEKTELDHKDCTVNVENVNVKEETSKTDECKNETAPLQLKQKSYDSKEENSETKYGIYIAENENPSQSEHHTMQENVENEASDTESILQEKPTQENSPETSINEIKTQQDENQIIHICDKSTDIEKQEMSMTSSEINKSDKTVTFETEEINDDICRKGSIETGESKSMAHPEKVSKQYIEDSKKSHSLPEDRDLNLSEQNTQENQPSSSIIIQEDQNSKKFKHYKVECDEERQMLTQLEKQNDNDKMLIDDQNKIRNEISQSIVENKHKISENNDVMDIAESTSRKIAITIETENMEIKDVEMKVDTKKTDTSGENLLDTSAIQSVTQADFNEVMTENDTPTSDTLKASQVINDMTIIDQGERNIASIDSAHNDIKGSERDFCEINGSDEDNDDKIEGVDSKINESLNIEISEIIKEPLSNVSEGIASQHEIKLEALKIHDEIEHEELSNSPETINKTEEMNYAPQKLITAEENLNEKIDDNQVDLSNDDSKNFNLESNLLLENTPNENKLNINFNKQDTVSIGEEKEETNSNKIDLQLDEKIRPPSDEIIEENIEIHKSRDIGVGLQIEKQYNPISEEKLSDISYKTVADDIYIKDNSNKLVKNSSESMILKELSQKEVGTSYNQDNIDKSKNFNTSVGLECKSGDVLSHNQNSENKIETIGQDKESKNEDLLESTKSCYPDGIEITNKEKSNENVENQTCESNSNEALSVNQEKDEVTIDQIKEESIKYTESTEKFVGWNDISNQTIESVLEPEEIERKVLSATESEEKPVKSNEESTKHVEIQKQPAEAFESETEPVKVSEESTKHVEIQKQPAEAIESETEPVKVSDDRTKHIAIQKQPAEAFESETEPVKLSEESTKHVEIQKQPAEAFESETEPVKLSEENTKHVEIQKQPAEAFESETEPVKLSEESTKHVEIQKQPAEAFESETEPVKLSEESTKHVEIQKQPAEAFESETEPVKLSEESTKHVEMQKQPSEAFESEIEPVKLSEESTKHVEIQKQPAEAFESETEPVKLSEESTKHVEIQKQPAEAFESETEPVKLSEESTKHVEIQKQSAEAFESETEPVKLSEESTKHVEIQKQSAEAFESETEPVKLSEENTKHVEIQKQPAEAFESETEPVKLSEESTKHVEIQKQPAKAIESETEPVKLSEESTKHVEIQKQPTEAIESEIKHVEFIGESPKPSVLERKIIKLTGENSKSLKVRKQTRATENISKPLDMDHKKEITEVPKCTEKPEESSKLPRSDAKAVEAEAREEVSVPVDEKLKLRQAKEDQVKTTITEQKPTELRKRSLRGTESKESYFEVKQENAKMMKCVHKPAEIKEVYNETLDNEKKSRDAKKRNIMITENKQKPIELKVESANIIPNEQKPVVDQSKTGDEINKKSAEISREIKAKVSPKALRSVETKKECTKVAEADKMSLIITNEEEQPPVDPLELTNSSAQDFEELLNKESKLTSIPITKSSQKPIATRKRKLTDRKSISESDSDGGSHFVTDSVSYEKSTDDETVATKKPRIRNKISATRNTRATRQSARNLETTKVIPETKEQKKKTDSKDKKDDEKTLQSLKFDYDENEDVAANMAAIKTLICKEVPKKEDDSVEDSSADESVKNRNVRKAAKGKRGRTSPKKNFDDSSSDESKSAKIPFSKRSKTSEPEETTAEKLSKKKRDSTGKGILKHIDTSLVIETVETETPIRQSRRIAQQKIKEETERRQMEEKMLKQMKEEAERRKKLALGGEQEIDHDEKDDSSDESYKDSRTKKKKKLPPTDRPWQTSSSHSEHSESEDEFERPQSEDPGSPLFRSDHEFSPESDVDDAPVQPVKRARTAKKQVEESSDDEDVNPNHACQVCHKTDCPEWILLCDECDHGYHCSCLKPIIFCIPSGNWYCPLCCHKKLVDNLTNQLGKLDNLVLNIKAEEIRQQKNLEIKKLTEVTEENIIKDRRKNRPESNVKDVQSRESKRNYDENESDDESSDNSSDNAPLNEYFYKLRRRNQTTTSYRFNDYDDLINSAIRDEMEEVKGMGNAGRGKDISTIIEADKEEKKLQKLEKQKETETDDNKKENEQEGGEESSGSEIVKNKKSIQRKKKNRKLNNLDETSEEDQGSDEDFKGSSSSNSDTEEEYSVSGSVSESSLDLPVKKSKIGKRSTRSAARNRRYDETFIDDNSSDDEPLIKKRIKKQIDSDEEDFDGNDDNSENSSAEDIDSEDLCDDTDTDDSSETNWPKKKKKKVASYDTKKPRKPVKKNDDGKDKAFRAGISKKKILKQSDNESDGSDNESVKGRRRTRGKKLLYLIEDDYESDDGIKPGIGVVRPETPPEEREMFVKKQEEIKRMLAEKNTEAARQLAVPTIEPIKFSIEKPKSPSPPPLLSEGASLSTIPKNVIEGAKALDTDYNKIKNLQFGSHSKTHPSAHEMSEEDLARMMEEEDFAQHQLKLVGESIGRNKLLELEVKEEAFAAFSKGTKTKEEPELSKQPDVKKRPKKLKSEKPLTDSPSSPIKLEANLPTSGPSISVKNELGKNPSQMPNIPSVPPLISHPNSHPSYPNMPLRYTGPIPHGMNPQDRPSVLSSYITRHENLPRLEGMPPRLEGMPPRLGSMPPRLQEMPPRLEAMPPRLEAMPPRLEGMPSRMPSRLEGLPSRMPSRLEGPSFNRIQAQLEAMRPRLEGMPPSVQQLRFSQPQPENLLQKAAPSIPHLQPQTGEEVEEKKKGRRKKYTPLRTDLAEANIPKVAKLDTPTTSSVIHSTLNLSSERTEDKGKALPLIQKLKPNTTEIFNPATNPTSVITRLLQPQQRPPFGGFAEQVNVSTTTQSAINSRPPFPEDLKHHPISKQVRPQGQFSENPFVPRTMHTLYRAPPTSQPSIYGIPSHHARIPYPFHHLHPNNSLRPNMQEYGAPYNISPQFGYYAPPAHTRLPNPSAQPTNHPDVPPNARNNPSDEPSESSEFGGLVSYFSSQQELD